MTKAVTKHTSTTQKPSNELRIEIYPRARDEWRGTQGQLIEEGIVPANFDWPEWPSSHAPNHFNDDTFEYTVWQFKPERFKGRWRGEGDCWEVCRRLLTQPLDGFATNRRYEKYQEMKRLEFELSDGGWELEGRCHQADCDEGYQSFRARMLSGMKA